MNHSRNTNDTTKTIMEKTYLPGETEPCLVRTDKTESIRIVNIDGSERKPSDVVAFDRRHSNQQHQQQQHQQPTPKMTCMEKVRALIF